MAYTIVGVMVRSTLSHSSVENKEQKEGKMSKVILALMLIIAVVFMAITTPVSAVQTREENVATYLNISAYHVSLASQSGYIVDEMYHMVYAVYYQERAQTEMMLIIQERQACSQPQEVAVVLTPVPTQEVVIMPTQTAMLPDYQIRPKTHK
jgi:hypothetical protein